MAAPNSNIERKVKLSRPPKPRGRETESNSTLIAVPCVTSGTSAAAAVADLAFGPCPSAWPPVVAQWQERQ